MPKAQNKIERTERKFQWTAQREKAAQLVAEDALTDEQISEAVGIVRSTLYEWRQRDEFLARVDEHVERYRASVRRSGIAILENRVAHLKRRHTLMLTIIEERGLSPEMQNVPGGKTGLMVHNVKSIGSGEHAERVDLYEVDAALLKELREHEMQTAKELGQWTERKDHTSNGKPIKAYADINDGDPVKDD